MQKNEFKQPEIYASFLIKVGITNISAKFNKYHYNIV